MAVDHIGRAGILAGGIGQAVKIARDIAPLFGKVKPDKDPNPTRTEQRAFIAPEEQQAAPTGSAPGRATGISTASLSRVKGGENVSVRDVRDLVGTVEREKALGGVLITPAAPTKPMLGEAARHGFASTGLGQFRRIMVKTIEELLRGVHDDGERLPPLGRGEGFRRAPKERKPGAAAQQALFD